MSDELPKGWAEAALPQVAELNMGQSPPSNTYNVEGKGLPFYQGKTEFGNLYPTPVKFCSVPSKVAEKDDILISVRAPVGPTNLCPEKSCIGRGLAGIRPLGEIPSRYLLYYLRSMEAGLAAQGTGSTFTAISKTDLAQLNVRLAPLGEQRRIVAKLETLLGKVDTSQQRLAKIPVLLKRFRQSVLAAACSGRLTADWREENDDIESSEDLIQKILDGRNKRYEATCKKCIAAGDKPPKRPKNLTRVKITHHNLPDIPETWEWACWDDLADWITYGFTRPMPHVAKGVPIITAKNVRDGFFDFSQSEFTTKEAFAELSEKDKPRRNEILITKDGAIRGRAALVETDEPFCISQAVAVVRFGGLTAHEPFLLRVVQSRFTQNLIEAESMGTAIPHISITNFGRFPVPLPPLPEQQEIVRRVEGLFALADQLEERLAKARGQVEKLTPSLLARAFAGQLVPQDPTDEPASVLLERIRHHPPTK
jgi:type I restriction enzyme, S subunit